MWISIFLAYWTVIFFCNSQEVSNFEATTATETSPLNQGVEWDTTGPSVSVSIRDGRSGNGNRNRNENPSNPLFYSNQWQPFLMPIGFNDYRDVVGRTIDDRATYQFLPTPLRRPNSDLRRNLTDRDAQRSTNYRGAFPPAPLAPINPMMFYAQPLSFSPIVNSYATDSISGLQNSSAPASTDSISNLQASSSIEPPRNIAPPANPNDLERLPPVDFYPSRERFLPPLVPAFAPPYPILPNRNPASYPPAVFPFVNGPIFDREAGSDIAEGIHEERDISGIENPVTSDNIGPTEAIATGGSPSDTSPSLLPPEPVPYPLGGFPYGILPPPVFPNILPNPDIPVNLPLNPLPPTLSIPAEDKITEENLPQPLVPPNLPLDSFPEVSSPVNALEPDAALSETIEANVGEAIPGEKPIESKIPYEFGYDMNDGQGNDQHRKEVSDLSGTVRGSYGYRDMFGVYRLVNYIADKNGFRAFVQSNEPGVASSGSADVVVMAERPPPEAIAEGEKIIPPEAIIVPDLTTDLIAEGSEIKTKSDD